MDNKKIKICNNWIKNICKFMKEKEKCNFAHGEDDIIKINCWNYSNCFNEDCKFNHHSDWKPKDNCLICLDSKKICNKKNNKYKHINNIKEEISKTITKVPKDDDFPELINFKEKKNNNIDKKKYTYSEILTYKIKSDLNIGSKNDINDEITKIKNKLKENYLYLKSLNPDEWANYDEIDKIEEDIKELRDIYNNIKNNDKKYDIFDDNLNFDIIFMEDNKNINNENDDLNIIPINLTINGISCDSMENLILKANNEKKDNIEILIENMEKQVIKYNELIKKHIINVVKDDYLKYILINDLNKINFKIIKLKNNYKDINNIDSIHNN